MNAVEIEQAVSDLAEQPFDAAEFPFAVIEGCLQQADDDQDARNRGVQRLGTRLA
jgi:hypothetical protein